MIVLSVDSHVPLQPREVGRGHVLRVPARRGRGQPLAELIDRRLGDQRHRHLAVADVEIARPCPIPAQRLMGVEELLHMPSLGEVPGQLLDLVAVAGREEGVEAVFLRPLPLPLDVLVERPGLAVLRGVWPASRSRSRPTAAGTASGGSAASWARRAGRLGIGTRRSNFVSVLTLSSSSAVKCSESARTSAWPGSGSRISPANFSNSSAAAAAVRAEVPVVKQIGWPVSASSTKKVWAVLVGRSRLVLAVGPHVPLAEAAHAMGIDGQQPAPEVARGAADLAEGHLEVAGCRRRCGPRAARGRPCRWRGTAGRWPTRRSAGSGCGGAATRCGTAPPRGSVATPGAVPRAPGLCPVQPQTRSQAPRRSNSGTSSQMPARFPMTLSARNCRTPCSMLRGSQGTGLVRFWLVRASMGGSGPGR